MSDHRTCEYCGRGSERGKFHEQQCNASIGYVPQPAMSELKNQELPPLDERCRELTEDLGSEDGDSDVIVRLVLDCRERQLLAALNELKAKHTELAAKEARIAELEKSQKMWMRHAVAAWDRADEDFLPRLEMTQRAAAAEKSLGAVSEVLKEQLPITHYPAHGTGVFVGYGYETVNDLLARLRSIVEGKVILVGGNRTK